MEFLKKMPATIALAVINTLVFGWLYLDTGTTDGPEWWLALLDHGGLYNALTLDGEWYRIFTHMFLHGHLLHLILNLYGLIVIGLDLEPHVGTRQFLLVYFLGGLAGALCSLYFNLFILGVGASGAIFALFGFGLVVDIRRNLEENHPIAPVIVNFVVFLGINILIAGPLNGDNAAHLGGALCGAVFGLLCVYIKRQAWAVIVPMLFAIYFLLPRYQVYYYDFFQEVLTAQDSSSYVLSHSGSRSNEDFLKDYRRVTSRWDTAKTLLNNMPSLPEELSSDTFKLRRVIRFHKAEADYRIAMVENERYIYADSIDFASDSLRKYTSLDYVLNLRYTPPDTTEEKPEGPPLETVKILYDSNWVEIPYPPAAFFRIGQRDTAGLWQGPLADYYRTGIVQMKGAYKDDMKDGIFIYYIENGGYSAAGVYNDDQRVGKWETFHPNGRLESEVYYRERYFMKNYWDSTGVQMVKDGYGREIHRYPNGVVASEGEYVDGYQEGYWYGRHKNGQMYFEENYNRGRLINGRSMKDGKTAVYDETIFFALPEGGYKKLNEHIRQQVNERTGPPTSGRSKGTVKLSFRVTVSGQLTDFKVETSVSKELDLRAKQIVLSGPRWLPARLHGQEPTDGYGVVSIEF